MSQRTLIGLALVMLVAAGGGVVRVMSAQTIRPIPAMPSTDELILAEIRGLRADLNQTASIATQAQLLVVRLQLQEQRINVVGGQLAELRTRLSATESERLAMAQRLDGVRAALGSQQTPPETRQDLPGVVKALEAELTTLVAKEQQLRPQESELSGLLLSEQDRWSYFNNRLDEIERSLPRK